MNKGTRTFKSIKNISYGVIVQLLSTVIKFISRTIFIKILGSELLGVNGLFTNILSILSLAELGFGQAIIYSMYKPIANKDETKIAALINFYKKVYNSIAIIVFFIGIILIPFLPHIVNTTINIEEVRIYYFIFLLSTVMSYVFSYKFAILTADQKQYIQNMYSLFAVCAQFILQTIILLTTRNYILYLIVQILVTLINNIILARKVNKMYPYIKNKEKMSKQEKEEIYTDVMSLFLYKSSGIFLNNTDNILISMLVGTIYVGYYSNYLMIISAINTFLTTVFYATTGSVGNLNAENNPQKQLKLYDFMFLTAGYIYTVCALILLFVINDFIQIWLGSEFLLDTLTMFVVIINFYMPGMLLPSWIFRDTTGMFRKTKFIAMITAIINLVLSVILGNKFGLFGILLATAISRLLTNYWYEPYVLYKNVFKEKYNVYIKKQITFILLAILSYLIIYLITKNIVEVSLLFIILKVIITIIVFSLLFVVFFAKTDEMKNFVDRVQFLLSNVLGAARFNKIRHLVEPIFSKITK